MGLLQPSILITDQQCPHPNQVMVLIILSVFGGGAGIRFSLREMWTQTKTIISKYQSTVCRFFFFFFFQLLANFAVALQRWPPWPNPYKSLLHDTAEKETWEEIGPIAVPSLHAGSPPFPSLLSTFHSPCRCCCGRRSPGYRICPTMT